MKKKILNALLIIAALFIFINNVQAQSGNKITISVKDIQYDDPNFAALRESLKKNPKVKLVKPSYATGVAILSFTYAGEASQLWEEIPKTSKRFFTLVEMNDDAITLNYLDPKKNAGNSSVVSTQSKPGNKKDCFDCDYFPLCKYDVTKTYSGGHVYRGIRESDESIMYYNCENGIVTVKWVTSSTPQYNAVDYDPFADLQTVIYYEGKPVYTTHTQIILKANAAVDEKWESEEDIHRKIITKNASVIIEGKKYDNVIVVCKWYNKYYQLVGNWRVDYSYVYYVKGMGDAFSEQADILSNPEPKIRLSLLQEFKTSLSAGRIDMSLVGTWSHDNSATSSEIFQINADGTYEHIYKGFEMKEGEKDQKGLWRVINDTLLFFNKSEIDKQQIEKINNQQTGKSSITMLDVSYRNLHLPAMYKATRKMEYKKLDNKTVVNSKEDMLDGISDPDIIGTWVIDNKSENMGKIAPYWKFNADGTGVYGGNETFTDSFRDNSFKWTIKNNILYQEMQGLHFQKVLKKLLPAISINGFIFKRVTKN